MIRFILRVAVCVLGAVALLGCQPVDELENLEPADGREGVEGERRGAPATGLPPTLTEALDRADEEAARWQDGARLAEAAVEVDDQDGLTQVRLTYLAADADRLLTVTVGPDGLREQRATLAAFDLTPISGDALDALPALPEGLLEPAALVEAAPAAFAECAVGGAPATVLYASGAPLAWAPDAQEWATPLAWTATVTADNGGGAVLDPVTAETLDCVEASA